MDRVTTWWVWKAHPSFTVRELLTAILMAEEGAFNTGEEVELC